MPERILITEQEGGEVRVRLRSSIFVRRDEIEQLQQDADNLAECCDFALDEHGREERVALISKLEQAGVVSMRVSRDGAEVTLTRANVEKLLGESA